MANLSPEEEQRIRENVKRYGVAVHNPNGWTYKSFEQRQQEAHARLAQEVSDLNVEYGTRYKYSVEKGVEINASDEGAAPKRTKEQQ